MWGSGGARLAGTREPATECRKPVAAGGFTVGGKGLAFLVLRGCGRRVHCRNKLQLAAEPSTWRRAAAAQLPYGAAAWKWLSGGCGWCVGRKKRSRGGNNRIFGTHQKIGSLIMLGTNRRNIWMYF